MKNRLAERERLGKTNTKGGREGEREREKACDTSYLGNDPSLCWGVALCAALVAPTPPSHTHTHTETLL